MESALNWSFLGKLFAINQIHVCKLLSTSVFTGNSDTVVFYKLIESPTIHDPSRIYYASPVLTSRKALEVLHWKS